MSLRAGSTRRRASSGSRSSISSIEPLISAKRAVTVLRSPSAASAWFVAETSGSAESPLDLMTLVPDAENFEPHLRQNLEPDGLLMPHEQQRSSILVPHSLQNTASGRFSA